MRYILFLLCFITSQLSAQVDTSFLNICSWNIQNFGKSKSPSEIEYICQKIKNFDIIAVQEVSTSDWGAKAIALLDDYLDRTGCDWDYIISNPTTGDGSERYAILFKKHRVKLVSFTLVTKLSSSINREPFLATFKFLGVNYDLYNLHLVPTAKFPQNEVKFLSQYFENIHTKSLIMGDFNLSSNHISFDNLKLKYQTGLVNQKTSLKMKISVDGEILNLPYDNFFISKNLQYKNCSAILFFKDFKSLEEARKISDHCPIIISIK
jgi:endonuclease/exonuclease/phosphatase family metal-dependent hydrolase